MRSPLKEARDELLVRLLPALQSLGYSKRAGSILTNVVSDDVIGWLSIQTTIRREDDVVAVDPTIGARHQVLERTVADLRGDTWHRYQPPTVSLLLGYVTSDSSPAHLLRSGEEIDSIVGAIVEGVRTAGGEYLAARATLAAIVDDIRAGRAPGIDHVSVRLPVGLWMLGEQDSAMLEVRLRLTDLGDR